MKRVYLEITNACNLNCPFCTYEKGNNYLDIEDIDDYLDQIKPYCNYIYLHILGEPLLHPHFDKILDLLDEKKMYLQLVSNGTLLNKYPDLLKHDCLRKLSISIHSINNINVDDSYFDTVTSLIDMDTDKNIELRFYDKNNLSIRLKEYLDYLEKKYGFSITSRNNSYRLNDHSFISFSQMFRWPDIDDEIISDKGYCHGGIDMIAINSNSDVCICCLDPEAHNRLGNLKEDRLKDILESGLYKEYINNIKNRKLLFDLCKKCQYRLRFDAENLLQDNRRS